MPLREAHDRRGRASRGSLGLLERETALEAIDEALEHAAAGLGAALVFEGHAGMGKTRLHEAALDSARGRGLRVIRGTGAELETNLAFGVAGQVLRSLIGELPEDERESLFESTPGRVLALAGGAEVQASGLKGSDLTIAHGLF